MNIEHDLIYGLAFSLGAMSKVIRVLDEQRRDKRDLVLTHDEMNLLMDGLVKQAISGEKLAALIQAQDLEAARVAIRLPQT